MTRSRTERKWVRMAQRHEEHATFIPPTREMLADRRLVELVCQLIGPNVKCVHSALFLKGPEGLTLSERYYIRMSPRRLPLPTPESDPISLDTELA